MLCGCSAFRRISITLEVNAFLRRGVVRSLGCDVREWLCEIDGVKG